MRAWPDDLIRMGIEGDDHERQAQLGRDLLRAGHDPAVTAVHAIEDADGDDGPAPVRWDVMQTLPAMHRQRPFPPALGPTSVVSQRRQGVQRIMAPRPPAALMVRLPPKVAFRRPAE